jgi:iron(III) transport system ATP-binding protein
MIDVEDLRIEYPIEGRTHVAVRDVSLHVAAGEFFTLLGPSGCGKTSTLRSIAGLEQPARGRVRIGDSVVFDAGRGIDTPAHRRDVSMVFQSYAIWPHLSVEQNVAFPLEVARVPAAERSRRVREALELVGLAQIGDRSATQLSGGQQQRVAIARGIVRRSAVLLLDEPLSNLDAKLREQMRIELRALLKQVGVTALYVTHDQEEALALSDRIAVMDAGRVLEIGTPADLYLRPATRFAATFLGQAEVFEVRGCRAAGDGHDVDTEIGTLRVAGAGQRTAVATHLMIRPEAMRVRAVREGERPDAPAARAAPVAGRDNLLAGVVTAAIFSGRHVAYAVTLAGGRAITVLAPPFDSIAPGTAVSVAVPAERVICVNDSR